MFDEQILMVSNSSKGGGTRYVSLTFFEGMRKSMERAKIEVKKKEKRYL